MNGSVSLLTLAAASLSAALALYLVSLRRRKSLDLLDWPPAWTGSLPEPSPSPTLRVAEDVAMIPHEDSHSQADSSDLAEALPDSAQAYTVVAAR